MEYIKTRIKPFISHSLHYDLQDHEDIFALGFVKSIFILQLVLFIEHEFDVTIQQMHLNIDNFRTVNAIAGLVERQTVLAA